MITAEQWMTNVGMIGLVSQRDGAVDSSSVVFALASRRSAQFWNAVIPLCACCFAGEDVELLSMCCWPVGLVAQLVYPGLRSSSTSLIAGNTDSY